MYINNDKWKEDTIFIIVPMASKNCMEAIA